MNEQLINRGLNSDDEVAADHSSANTKNARKILPWQHTSFPLGGLEVVDAVAVLEQARVDNCPGPRASTPKQGPRAFISKIFLYPNFRSC